MANDVEIRQYISRYIEGMQGCKAMEVVAHVAQHYDWRKRDKTVIDVLEEMVKEGELVEVEYVLPSMDYRVKSFLLPKGTVVRIGGISVGSLG